MEKKFSWIDIPESEVLKKGLCDEYEFQWIVKDGSTRYQTIIEMYSKDAKLTLTDELDADFKYRASDGETHYIFIF